MSDLQATICDMEQSIHHRVELESANAAIAALSADPESIAELETAIGRFHKPVSERGMFDGWTVGVPCETSDSHHLVIDLAARVIVRGHRDVGDELTGHVQYYDGACLTDVWLPYHLADEWDFVERDHDWRAIAAERRQMRASSPPLDSRSVLYGELAPFIVEHCVASFECERELPPTADAFDERSYAAVSDIHARWLSTPRDDLLGQAPREVMLDRYDLLRRDMDDRQRQWSMLGECPPGLSQKSAAFKLGGFGTHEIVIYYDLVRYLLWSCWDHLKEMPAGELAGLDVDVAVDRVSRYQQDWLNTPQNDELCGKSPIYVIHRERSRIPLVVPRDSLMIDCDCPICQLMADAPGPTFWHLDGCHMDEDFAFSFYQSKNDWDLERQSWSDFRSRAD